MGLFKTEGSACTLIQLHSDWVGSVESPPGSLSNPEWVIMFFMLKISDDSNLLKNKKARTSCAKRKESYLLFNFSLDIRAFLSLKNQIFELFESFNISCCY
jgi:hypothetical protein